MSSPATSSPRRTMLFENIRQDLAAALLEFVGTTLFLLLGLGGIQASANSNTFSQRSPDGNIIASSGVAPPAQLLYIATSMGLSLLVSAWAFYRVTGAVFNPNIGFALLLVGAISPVRFILYCIAQFTGSIVAMALLDAMLPGAMTVSCAPSLTVTATQAIFIEMFITAGLTFIVLMLAVEKHAVTPMAPVAIGLTLFAGHLFAVVYTGAATNTARAFGPAVIAGFDDAHWVYWVGPSLGAALAAGIYTLLKRFDYETLNPGQDASHSKVSVSPPSVLPTPVQMKRGHSESVGSGDPRPTV